jgi:hypothetical protein
LSEPDEVLGAASLSAKKARDSLSQNRFYESPLMRIKFDAGVFIGKFLRCFLEIQARAWKKSVELEAGCQSDLLWLAASHLVRHRGRGVVYFQRLAVDWHVFGDAPLIAGALREQAGGDGYRRLLKSSIYRLGSSCPIGGARRDARMKTVLLQRR